MKKALLVSYVFPPMAAVGGQRVVYFCRHLRKFGWGSVVLTTRNAGNISIDASLLEHIPNTPVYRAGTFEPILKRDIGQKMARPRTKVAPTTTPETPLARPSLVNRIKHWIKLALSVPDHAIFWVPFAVIKGLGVIRREKPSVIFSSSPPVSSHIVASLLSRLTGLPHVVDFRDLWTLNHLYEQRAYPRFFKAYDRYWESLVLKRAAAIVTASPGFTRQLQEYQTGRFEAEIETITNGFDYQEIEDLRLEPRPSDDPFRFIYVGSLYSDFNPEFFFEGLAGWLERSCLDQSKVRADFYGNTGYDYTGWLADAGLSEIVRFHGFKSRSELLPQLVRVDCLLLFLGFNPAVRHVIPAKLFEYLASGTPILATAPRGVTSDLIDRHRAGFWIDRPDRERLIEMLEHLYADRVNDKDAAREYKYLSDIDRVNLTDKLSQLFEQVSG